MLTSDDFQLVQENSTNKSGNRKGGGDVSEMVQSLNISLKVQCCTRKIELLVVSIQPYYLPREFLHVIMITVYILPPPSASQLQTWYPQSFLLICIDFNNVSVLKSRTGPLNLFFNRFGSDFTSSFTIQPILSHHISFPHQVLIM